MGCVPIVDNGLTFLVNLQFGIVDMTGHMSGVVPTTAMHGIHVAVIREPLVHGCSPTTASGVRTRVRAAPSDLIADLSTIGGIGIGEVTETHVDGRTALVTDVDPELNRCAWGDIHFVGSAFTFVDLRVPSRLFVTDVEGTTVLIHIWAPTEADLRTWMPNALLIVDSIHFIH